MIKNEKIQKIVLLFLSLISFFSTLWIRGADLMESRNFITAREIVRSGNWLVTTLNGEYRFEKPPLPTWLTAITMKIFNTTDNETILRVPVSLATVLLIFLVYKLVKEISNNGLYGFFSAFVLSSTFMIIKLGGENAWDMYPYVFMTGTIAYLIDGFKNNKISKYIVSALFLSASLMSKGPIALYGMFLPFFISFGIVNGFNIYKKYWKQILLTILLGFLVASIWPIFMIVENKDLFFSVMNKEKDTWSNKHIQSIFFYLNYFVFMGIWIFIAAISWFKLKFFKKIKEYRVFSVGFYWTLSTIIFLSLIKMKKERYGLPIYITSSLTVGSILYYYYITIWNKLQKSDKILLKIQGIFLAILSIGVPIFTFVTAYRNKIVGIDYLSLITFIYFGALFYIVNSYIANKERYKNSIIFLSGIFMIIININCTWIIERYIRGDYKTDFKYLESLKAETILDDIYADDYDIVDVWNVGKKIKKYDKNTELPDEFLFLSTSEVNKEILKTHEVIKKDELYRFRNDDKKINLYLLKKRTDMGGIQ